MSNHHQDNLAERFKLTRSRLNLSLQDIEDQTGISKATLSRFERRRGSLDSENESGIRAWIRTVDPQPDQTSNGISDTVEDVKRLLRNDPALSPAVAASLGELMALAYSQFTTPREN